MSNYNFNGNITGNNNHFGDTSNYSTVNEFIAKNKDVRFTNADIELFNLIVDNVETEEEKWKIIESLRSIKIGELNDNNKKKTINILTKFIKGIKDVAQGVTIKIATEKISNFLLNNNAGDILNSIEKHIH